jgi:hypothetical protein
MNEPQKTRLKIVADNAGLKKGNDEKTETRNG